MYGLYSCQSKKQNKILATYLESLENSDTKIYKFYGEILSSKFGLIWPDIRHKSSWMTYRVNEQTIPLANGSGLPHLWRPSTVTWPGRFPPRCRCPIGYAKFSAIRRTVVCPFQGKTLLAVEIASTPSPPPTLCQRRLIKTVFHIKGMINEAGAINVVQRIVHHN